MANNNEVGSMDLELSCVTGMGSDKSWQSSTNIPQFVEQWFRWIDETIFLIYKHHTHPLPMVALIFMSIETLGKPLTKKKRKRVETFVADYMPNLWKALERDKNREKILRDYYRNGLIHQMFMKNNHAIHEKHPEYVRYDIPDTPVSININFLVPEFLKGLRRYYERLNLEPDFLETFLERMPQND